MTGRDTTKLQPILTDVSIRYDHKRTEFHFARIGNRSEGESRNHKKYIYMYYHFTKNLYVFARNYIKGKLSSVMIIQIYVC